MKLRIRAAGCPDFDVEIGPDATVVELKVEATAGCDIDPDAMKVIHRGKVLKDGDTLQASGVDGSQPLHVARGKSAVEAPAPAAAIDAQQSTIDEVMGGSAVLKVGIKGPGGVEASLDVPDGETLSQMRGRAAALFGLSGQEIHLVLRGKMLKDEDTIAASGLKLGDVLRVARRAVQAPVTQAPAAVPSGPDYAAAAGGAGVAMPNAFGGAAAPMDLQAIQRQLAGVGNHTVDMDPAAVEALQQQLYLATLRRQAEQVREMQVPVEVRLPREVRIMEHHVRRLVALQQGVDVESIEEDPALLDLIARTMAQARARGAPVPDPVFFVNQALTRATEARALNARLQREADGLDPEIEDALMAIDNVTAAAATAPRRLGRE